MYDDTPNKEEIDWIADRARDIYNYDKLKDCDIDYLHNLEFNVEANMMRYESSFPHGNSPIQGERRAMLYDDPADLKESLTEQEKLRLMLLKEEIRREIRRAKGHRIQLRRKHRGNLANAFSDAINGLGNAIGSIFPPW